MCITMKGVRGVEKVGKRCTNRTEVQLGDQELATARNA
jgi:hypothetical protein